MLDDWFIDINRTGPVSGNGVGENKLRTYSRLKHQFGSEYYLEQMYLPPHSRAYWASKCRITSIPLETGMYKILALNERMFCFFHNRSVEYEQHVLLLWNLHHDDREEICNVDSFANFILIPLSLILLTNYPLF
jgi:hypothetical protein